MIKGTRAVWRPFWSSYSYCPRLTDLASELNDNQGFVRPAG